MKARNLVKRLGVVSILAISIGLTAQLPAAASGDCYYYNYSNSVQGKAASGITYYETVWWTVGYSCNGQPMHENVTKYYEQFTISGASGSWTYQMGNTLLENGNGTVIWQDYNRPVRYGSGTVAKNGYPNFWFNYDQNAMTDETMSSCSVYGGANYCEGWHVFANGSLSLAWGV